MDDLVNSKLLPELKITVGTECNSDDELTVNLLEDGELLDPLEDAESTVTVNKPTVKSTAIVRSWMTTLQTPKVYQNKDCFITGIDLSSDVLKKKLACRAERFGIDKEERSQITQEEIDDLYESLNIDSKDSMSINKSFRMDTLHMRGVEDMNTNEIFKYFVEFGPSSVEWINDVSCNVCWIDAVTAARALLTLSYPLDIPEKYVKSVVEAISSETNFGVKRSDDLNTEKSTEDGEIQFSNESDTEVAEASPMEIDTQVERLDCKDDPGSQDEKLKTERASSFPNVPVPPGNWRLGVPHPKAKAILLRFASKEDKKLPGAEKRSQFYQKYGNPNYGGLKGLISNSKKRKIQAAKKRQIIDKITEDAPSNSDNELDFGSNVEFKHSNRPKMPRMKMYADDEEKKIRGKGLQFSKQTKSVHSRLGRKYAKEDLYHLGSRYSSESEDDQLDNVSINCTVPSKYDVWTDIAKSMSKDEYPEKPNPQPYQKYDERYFGISRKRYRDSNASDSKSKYDTCNHSQDLRMKLQRIKEDSSHSKHRSPLLKSD